jgi:hypothetical protein
MVRRIPTRIAARPALLVLLAVLAPPSPVTPGPPQQVVTSNPLIGVHTRLTDEVDPWVIRQSLRLAREMGAPWIVEFFPWPYFEDQPGYYDWARADLIVDLAREQGLEVVARLGAVPDWARPKPEEFETNWNYLAADHYDDYAAYVGAFVAHFKGRVRYVIILNEPNLTREWGFRPVDPEGYVDVLARAYARAKAANPGVQVLAGALAPTLEPEGSQWGLEDTLFLERLYRAGFARYYDVLAVHAYGLTHPPDDPPAPDALNFRRVELLRAIMERYGDGDKPIMITESGWNDQPRWNNGVRPAQRVRYTIDAFEYARLHWPWCRMVAMWVLKYPAPFHNYMDNFAFVAPDLTPRVVYLEVQAYSQGVKR